MNLLGQGQHPTPCTQGVGGVTELALRGQHTLHQQGNGPSHVVVPSLKVLLSGSCPGVHIVQHLGDDKGLEHPYLGRKG